MTPRACDRCDTLHLENPPACRNCGFHLFRSVSEDELIDLFTGCEACCACETVHTEHLHRCRNCEHQFFRPLSDSELLDKIEEILEAKRSQSSEHESDCHGLRQYLSKILISFRS